MKNMTKHIDLVCLFEIKTTTEQGVGILLKFVFPFAGDL